LNNIADRTVLHSSITTKKVIPKTQESDYLFKIEKIKGRIEFIVNVNNTYIVQNTLYPCKIGNDFLKVNSSR